MKIYIEGEKSKGLCEVCKKLVTTTFRVSSVKVPSRKSYVNGILVARCDECNHIVSIPQQSSPRIKEFLNTKKYSIEVRLPIHLVDILNLASEQFEMGSSDQLKDSLVRYYIALADANKTISKNVMKLSESKFAKGSGFRLSFKVNQIIYDRFNHLMVQTGLNKTQLIKGLILQINEDILQKPQRKVMNELEKVMFASA